MKVKFWGVRGSIASPGPKTVRYGGNTTCIEIRTDSNELIILDAGTGTGSSVTADQSAMALAWKLDFAEAPGTSRQSGRFIVRWRTLPAARVATPTP